MDLGGLDERVLQIAALLVALGIIFRLFIKFYKFLDKMEDAWRKVSAIAMETRPNGGSSLRDAVDTTATAVTELVTAVATTQRDLERVQDRLDRTDTSLSAVNGWLMAYGIQQETLAKNLTTRDPEARTRDSDLPTDRRTTSRRSTATACGWSPATPTSPGAGRSSASSIGRSIISIALSAFSARSLTQPSGSPNNGGAVMARGLQVTSTRAARRNPNRRQRTSGSSPMELPPSKRYVHGMSTSAALGCHSKP